MKCKALKYWEMIDNNWLKDASINRFKKDFDENKAIGYKQMDEFIENSFVFFGRDGGDLYEAIHNKVLHNLKKQYSDVELEKMLNTTIPTDLLDINKDGNIIYIDHNPHSDYYYEYIDGQVNSLLCEIQIAYDIGGKSAIKELKNIYKNIDNKIYDYFLTKPTKAYMEQKLYGDDKMENVFFEELAKLNVDDDISVYWDGNESDKIGVMYVNDESENQALETTTLFEAYKFAILINANSFDYVASDELVKELSEQMLNLIDEDVRKINIWEYIDDISDDFEKLTGRKLNIDDKRHIVCCMTEIGRDDYDLLCGFGTSSLIAKMLWDYIKGNEKANIKGCDNETINKLADEYLQTDEYNLKAFANALHYAVSLTPREQAIEEINNLLNEVKDVQRLMKEFGIHITSDTWSATDCRCEEIPNYNENILVWEKEDFEKLDFNTGDKFYVGGCIMTGCEHQYKDKYIIAPRELAETEAEIVEKYLKSIIDSMSLKYFNLEFSNPYGLIDNCGWENWMIIEAKVRNLD